MKWYWWLIIVFVPLGLVAYFFYRAGEKKNDQLAKARDAKAAKSEEKKSTSDPVVDPDLTKSNE